MVPVASLPTLEELRTHVHATLCRHDALDPKQTPLWQALLTRRGKPCGPRDDQLGVSVSGCSEQVRLNTCVEALARSMVVTRPCPWLDAYR